MSSAAGPAFSGGSPGDHSRLATLVVHCSDYRFRRAFNEFIEQTLAIAEYDRIAVPGGPQFLVALDYLPKFGWVGIRWTRFLVEMHGLKRVVLIAHEDCGWYRHVHGSHAELEARQREDLHRAREQLREILPGITVATYLATLHDGKIGFLHVEAATGI